MPRQISDQKRGSAVMDQAGKEAFERRDLVLAEAAEKSLLDDLLGRDELREKHPPRDGQLEIGRATILGMRHASNEPLLLETVDHSRHRPRIVGDRLAERRRRIGLAI